MYWLHAAVPDCLYYCHCRIIDYPADCKPWGVKTMLEWINALLNLFGSFCTWFLTAPFYGSIKIGYVLIAGAIMGVMINFLIRRFR
jgi:hypothetical protein